MATIKNVVTVVASRTIARNIAKSEGSKVVDNGTQAGSKRWGVAGDKVVTLKPSGKSLQAIFDNTQTLISPAGKVTTVITNKAQIRAIALNLNLSKSA